MLAKKSKTEYRKKMNKIREYLYSEYSSKGETERLKALIDKIYNECAREGMT